MDLYTQCESQVMQTTGLSVLSNDDDKFSSLSTSALLARGGVPQSHSRIADNYMIIKKIYGFSALQSRINILEKSLLSKYDFNTLEFCTIKQVNEELVFLKKWSSSSDEALSRDADELLQIRCKELKFIIASNYSSITNEIYNGYLAYDKYFEDISKYYC